MTSPADLPPWPDEPSAFEDPANDAAYAPPPTGPVLLDMSKVEARPVEWLWRNWIPAGKISLADGDPGKGKSLFTVDLAARVTTGNRMPDGSDELEGPYGVVMVSAEDDPNDTVKPRLVSAMADCSRVRLLTHTRYRDKNGEVRSRDWTIADIDDLRGAIHEVGAKLVVIDPLMAYLRGDAHRDNEVRASLMPLKELASETGAAIVIVRHLNKSGGGSPIYRGGGSIGIIGAARSAFMFGLDPEDESGRRHIMAPTKSNVGRRPKSMAYEIAIEDEVPRIRWLGEAEESAEDLLTQERGRQLKRDDAMDLLLAELAHGPVAARDLYDQADAVGISKDTLKRAKTALGVHAYREGGSAGAWMWRLKNQRG